MKKYLFCLLTISSLFLASCGDSKNEEKTDCIAPAEWKGTLTSEGIGTKIPMNFYLDGNGKGWEVYTEGKQDIKYELKDNFLYINHYNKYKIIECTGNTLKMEQLAQKKDVGEVVFATAELEKVK
ncbi:MAG: hypothetical protein JXR58_09640 [Bacteroidales bacterium]|nr:hypothetical protein [Bacteroidales bacterium]